MQPSPSTAARLCWAEDRLSMARVCNSGSECVRGWHDACAVNGDGRMPISTNAVSVRRTSM